MSGLRLRCNDSDSSGAFNRGFYRQKYPILSNLILELQTGTHQIALAA